MEAGVLESTSAMAVDNSRTDTSLPPAAELVQVDAPPAPEAAPSEAPTAGRVSARRQTILAKRQVLQQQQMEQERLEAEQQAQLQRDRQLKLAEKKRLQREQAQERQNDTTKQQPLTASVLNSLASRGSDERHSSKPQAAVAAAQAPPSPTPTSESISAVPTFITDDPLSSDPDSSSDEDAFGRPKPPREPLFDSRGLRRPRPSYYYDADFDPASGGNKKRGRRGGMKGIPVFEPTMDEFEGQGGFYGYVKRIEKYGLRSGVVKVIPPKEWSDKLPSTADPLKEIRLREPIEQLMMGSQGLYRVTNVAKTRIWNPAQWKDMATKDKWAPPDFKGEKGREDRSERKVPEIRRRKRERRESEGEEDDEREGNNADGDEEQEAEDEADETSADEEEQCKTRRSTRQSVGGAAGRGRGRGRGRGQVKLGRGGSKAIGKGKGRAQEKEKADDGDEPPLQQATPPDTTHEQDTDMADATASTSKTTTTPGRAPPTRARAAAAAKEAATASKPSSPARKAVASAAVASTSTPKAQGTAAAAAAANADSAPAKKRLTNLQRAEPTDEEWAAFVAQFEELPHGMKKEDYTVELMRDVERRYWRTLTFGEAPMYGADMAGSLFDDSTSAWNVAKLGDLLPRLAPADCKIPGVVTPYLYFGMWRATFAWHVEDADLYSINYIHFGAPKFWYSVPQEQSERFERVMEGFFPTDRAKCSQFLRHKAFLASPRVLANSGITLNRVAQMPGEFILTYPKGYHSGFNLGFNCAESINFATSRWLPLGKVAKSCYCIGDSVNINVDAWLTEAAKAEALERGEPWPPVRSLPTPPPAPAPKIDRPASPPLVPTPPVVKRKRPAQDKGKSLAVNLDTASVASEVSSVPNKKAKLEAIVAEAVKKPVEYTCALCPEQSTEGLVKIGEPGIKSRKTLKAHRVCAIFTPATWIETDPATNEELVRGFGSIEKARWKLKCQLCTEAHGTKVQCTKGKCAKAIHVTCGLRQGSGYHLDATVAESDNKPVSLLEAAATSKLPVKSKLAAGVSTVASTSAAVASKGGTLAVVDNAPSPATGEEGSAAIQLSVLCRTHNPDWQKQEAQRKADELKERVEALRPKQRIRVRTNNGVFDVTLVEVLPARQAVALMFDDGKRFEAKWKMIVWELPAIVEQPRTIVESRQADYVYDGPKIKPSKKRSSYPPPQPQYGYPMMPPSQVPPPPGAYYAGPPPQAYHPQQAPGYSAYYAHPPPPPAGVAYNSPSPHAAPYLYPHAPPPPPNGQYVPYYAPPPGYPTFPPPPPHQAWGPPPSNAQRQSPQHMPRQQPPPPQQQMQHPQQPMHYSPYGQSAPLGPSPQMSHAQPYYPPPPQYAPPHQHHYYEERGHGLGLASGPPQGPPQGYQYHRQQPPVQHAPSSHRPQPSPQMMQQRPPSQAHEQQSAPNRSPTFANILDSRGGRQTGAAPMAQA